METSVGVEDIDWLKRIDLTKGFTSWHVKWPIGILGQDNGWGISSDKFHTPLGQNQALKFSWRLMLGGLDNDDADKFWVTMSSKYPPVATPLIYRFAICYENEDPIFTRAKCVMFTAHGEFEMTDIERSILKHDVNLTIHCWMDIPNDIVKFIGTRRKRRLEEVYEGLVLDQIHIPSNTQDFLDNSEALYKGAIGEDEGFKSLSDITLAMVQKSANSDGRFYCQRSILAARSSVFHSMFTTQWKEGNDRIVEIDGIKEKIMKMVLYHICTGQFLKMDEADLPDLVYAAEKYQLKQLKAWSEAQLITGSFKDEDRFDHLLLAERHQLHQLKAACIAMLSSKVFKFQAYSSLSNEVKDEMINAISKRQVDTKEINTVTDPNWGLA